MPYECDELRLLQHYAIDEGTRLASEHDHRSDGQKALFKLYPATFKRPISPSHRDFRFDDAVRQATRENAKVAKLSTMATALSARPVACRSRYRVAAWSC
ncbi:DUF1329 domain-containing protein [Pseudomonas sp. KCA11]|jgi:hypothetical protein|uniref:DUF1329 domain-containing protein n=1 Tax=Pseudomonas sp. TaxID=306 RepID=UPI001F3373D2|nr:DUF1329 domain-containing protein [Pseudomonas sp. KCA11]MCE5990656.1 DUF1329 domain-containing protein [Pseudomonas sp. KCA11]